MNLLAESQILGHRSQEFRKPASDQLSFHEDRLKQNSFNNVRSHHDKQIKAKPRLIQHGEVTCRSDRSPMQMCMWSRNKLKCELGWHICLKSVGKCCAVLGFALVLVLILGLFKR